MAVLIQNFKTWFYHRIMYRKDAAGKANSADPDQIAPLAVKQIRRVFDDNSRIIIHISP